MLEELEAALDLRDHVARVLGIPAASVKADRVFAELGMDSLMAIELKNALVAATGQPLKLTVVNDYPTVAALAEYLGTLLNATTAPAARCRTRCSTSRL